MRTLIPSTLFVLVMAQPNLATGMMPLYRSAWDLAPLLITVIFAAYLFALVPALTVLGRPAGRGGWWWRISVGCAVGVAADVVMAVADSAAIACVARVAAGLCVGLVTGSISGLILERRGERGRTTMATATVLGSAVGTIAAASFAQYVAYPRVSVYLLHAVLLSVAAVAVVIDRAGVVAHADLETVTRSTRPVTVPQHRPMTGYLCGIAAWVSAGLVVALLPSYGAQMLDTHNLAVLAAPVTVYLLSAWAAQRTVTPTSRAAHPVAAQAFIVVGVLVAALVPLVPQISVLLVAGVIAGVGQGLAYRAGIQIVSAGTHADDHARAASRYAAVAYLFAAVATVGFGVVATVTSMSVAVVTAVFVLSVVAAFTTITARSPESVSATSPEHPSDALVR